MDSIYNSYSLNEPSAERPLFPVYISNQTTVAPRTTETPVRKKRIIAKRGNTYIPLTINSIAVFYSSQRVLFAIDFKGNKFVLDKNLAEVEEILDRTVFFKANRNIILNVDAIKEFRVIEHGKIVVQLASPEWVREEIQISQYTAPQFKEWISSL